jgi:hypothetical protein
VGLNVVRIVYANEPRDSFLFQFAQGLHHAVRLVPLCEIFFRANAVKLQKIQAVGAQPLEADLDFLHGAVVRAVACLGRKEYFFAPSREHPAVVGLRLACAVGRRGIEVVYPGVERGVGHLGRIKLRGRSLFHAGHAAYDQRADLDACFT